MVKTCLLRTQATLALSLPEEGLDELFGAALAFFATVVLGLGLVGLCCTVNIAKEFGLKRTEDIAKAFGLNCTEDTAKEFGRMSMGTP